MRPILSCATFILSVPFLLFSGEPKSPAPVTVVLDFDQPHSEKSLQAMQGETQAILSESGIHLDWQFRSNQAKQPEFPDVVVVKMKGKCSMDLFPMPLDERGPLAFTYRSDGEMLPFSEVQCDRIRQSIRRVMTGKEYKQGDEILGRALGRVLAHEMYHIFAHNKEHSQEGVTKERLSASQLIAERLQFSHEATERIQVNKK